LKNVLFCFGSRKSEVQILSPRPVSVRNEVENGDCHGGAFMRSRAFAKKRL
jgi:hypothetical protein